MDVLAAAPSQSNRPPTAQEAADVDPTSDFDTFLTLLTAQIRNQDPLEPADATDYTAQLATFSNVEQAVQTNDLLAQMISKLDSQQVAEASGFIGMEVRHSGAIAHRGESALLATAVHPTADRAELVVRDLAGTEVARQPIDPDAAELRWPVAGRGGTVPDGIYDLSVESWAGDQILDPTPVTHYAKVREAVLAESGTELILAGGVKLPIGQLQAIRQAEGD